MRISGAVGVVTGGASGLGAATVEALAAAGARVVIADLPSSRGAAVAERLGEAVEFAPTDVLSEADVTRVLDRAAELGPLRVAVSCAGVGTPGRIVSRGGPLPLQRFAQVVQVNLIGTFNLLRLAAVRMAEHAPLDGDRGVIVNTASIAAWEGQVGQAAYAASKGGVVGLTLPAARELAEHRIRVCAIAPGLFDTPMLAALPAPARQSLIAAVPHPARLGEPAEFAALVCHIVENSMLNGVVIRLDGALRMPPTVRPRHHHVNE
jgi:NAD(P)-dependent dehydrogenase (short-subunit alcohol dehydrogenase family)